MTKRKKRNNLRRRRFRRPIVMVHRWTALTLGLLLLAVTTSGVIVLYQPEYQRWRQAQAFVYRDPQAEKTVSIAQSVDIARTQFPDTEWSLTQEFRGLYLVDDAQGRHRVTISGVDGSIIGEYDPLKISGPGDWLMQFADNFHLCLLTCAGQPGYQAWLTTEVPRTAWLNNEESLATGSSLLLGGTAIFLLALALSGLWLWWPGLKRFNRGFRIRWGKGRFARDFDLHQLIGLIAIPFLFLWGITGAGFEFQSVTKLWYAALPGSEPTKIEFASAPAQPENQPDLSPAAAVRAAQAHLGVDSAPTGITLPAADDEAGYFDVYFADGFDPYRATEYAGDLAVSVDRRTGRAATTFGGPGRGISAQLWEEWNFPTHTGFIVNPWWRLLWVVLGLTPTALALTGSSTWLWRKKVRRRQLAARAAAPKKAVLLP